MAGHRAKLPWFQYRPLLRALGLSCVLLASLAAAEASDQNAPFQDAYDVQHRDRLLGAWQGTISGSSVSQAEEQMAGQAVFVERGYDGRNDFGIILHDHRHRDGADYSQIHVGAIPCGPKGGAIRAVHGLELQSAPAGSYASVLFDNRLADTGRDDFLVHPVYGPQLDNPANLQTHWSDDGFTLRLTGQFVSIVAPVRDGTFDFERQAEGWIEQLHLDVEFTLENTPENQAAFNKMMCEEPDAFQVVETFPVHGRENVILEGADFFVEFSDAVAKHSLNPSTVSMTTRDPNNGFIFVEVELSLEDKTGLEDEEVLRIAPREPLRSGTIYEIAIAGGQDGLRGSDRQVLEEDYEFAFSTTVDPDNLRLGIYQVTRNAPVVYGKPAAARIEVEWEELDDIHPEWQVLDYPVRAEVVDNRDNTIFPELRERVQRPDQYTDEDRRLGEHTIEMFGWAPSGQTNPRNVRVEVTPDNHYPEDVEITPAMIEQSLDYATQSVDLLTFDYYIAAHSEWRDNIDIEYSRQVVQAAQQDRTFANQILPVAKIRGRFQGTYNLQDTICAIPGVEWVVCEDGFRFWDNPAGQATDFNKWNALVRLFHEHVAAQSDADILVSYHPPSLGGAGTTATPFEQPESLRRSGDEPYWFGSPDPHLLDSLHADRTSQNTIIMSTGIPDNRMFPGILLYPLVAHEFGHVFGLPHTPYAQDDAHKREICQAGYQTVAPGIDGMRIALDGTTGWQKSSEHGNAQTHAPLLNLMFPCIYEPHSDYWIDQNQYNWLVENMPEMLRYTRSQRASMPLFSRVQLAGPYVKPNARWIMLSGLAGEAEATLMPAIGVPGPRKPLSGNGPYELRAEDAAGRLLARASVGPDPFNFGPWPFAVTVPVSGTPARIVLLRDGEVLAERRADPHLVAPDILSHAPDSIYRAGERLEWSRGATEGITYAVRFTSDGEAWTTLAVLLREPHFTPDPATLKPGSSPVFEIVAYDGVTERVTRLPVEIDVPLEPLATWPKDGAPNAQGDNAQIAFNVPINADTLDGVTLEADGTPVPAYVTLDPSGMIVTIAPQEPTTEVVYTALAEARLRAQDGRPLNAPIKISFTAEPPETLADAPTEEPAWEARQDERSARSDLSEAAHPADGISKRTTIVGTGSISLKLGEAITVPVQIHRCQTDAEGRLLQIHLDFETTPGDRVDIQMGRDESDALTIEMVLGNGSSFSSQGDETDGWHFEIERGQVSVQGQVGKAGGLIDFTMTGECFS